LLFLSAETEEEDEEVTVRRTPLWLPATLSCVFVAFLGGYLLGSSNHRRGQPASSASTPRDQQEPLVSVAASSASAPAAPDVGASGTRSDAGGAAIAPPKATGGDATGQAAVAVPSGREKTDAVSRTGGEGTSPARPRQPDAPRIKFAEEGFDFGSLHQMTDKTHEFVFTNPGGSRLEIKNVKSTCGCAAAAATGRYVDPGDSGIIRVTFRSGTMRGTVNKEVRVLSNDPDHPEVVLAVGAEIKADLAASPRGVYIGKLLPGQTHERQVVIHPVEAGKVFNILAVTWEDPNVHVEDPVRLATGTTQYSINVRYGPNEKVGRVNDVISVRTDSEDSPVVPIPIYGQIVEEGASEDVPTSAGARQ